MPHDDNTCGQHGMHLHSILYSYPVQKRFDFRDFETPSDGTAPVFANESASAQERRNRTVEIERWIATQQVHEYETAQRHPDRLEKQLLDQGIIKVVKEVIPQNIIDRPESR